MCKCFQRLFNLGFNSYHRVCSCHGSKTQCFWASSHKTDNKLLSVRDFMVSFQQGKDKGRISTPRETSDRWAQDAKTSSRVTATDSAAQGREEGEERICLVWLKVKKQKHCQYTRATACCYGNWSAGCWGVMGSLSLTVTDDSIPQVKITSGARGES